MRLLLVILLLCCSPAQAHDARPVAVIIVETLPGVYTAMLRVPPTLAADNIPALVWPQGCRAMNEGDARSAASAWRCDAGLRGTKFRLDYPAFNPSLATFYRLQPLDALAISALLAPSEDVWTVPEATTRGSVARDYLLLGLEHIIGGLDHLLFVLGLLVIARTPRRILLAITGFTLAHSLTLSLSALGFVAIPIAPVEAVIALSILFLAHEIASPHADNLAWRQPLLVPFGFGLLHGLGFASALGEIGLVRDEIIVSLLFFNLGVELGQLLFILAVAALVVVLRGASARLVRAGSPASLPSPPGGMAMRRMDLLVAYVIGVPSAYWLVERVAGFLL
ncbi:MAG: HupE/UreJ family protein [Gammaproteobacteria bacterium]